MNSTTLGHIRVVDYNSPWLPPRLYKNLEDTPADFVSHICRVQIPVSSVPIADEHRVTFALYENFVCTRAPHGTDEIHVCHFWWDNDTAVPAFAVVWGGE